MPDADLTDRLDRIPSFARASLDRLRQMKAAARAGDFAVAPRERLKATQRLLADFVYIYDRCLAEPTSDEVERRLAELANGVIRPLASRPIDADETPSRRGRAYQAAQSAPRSEPSDRPLPVLDPAEAQALMIAVKAQYCGRILPVSDYPPALRQAMCKVRILAEADGPSTPRPSTLVHHTTEPLERIADAARVAAGVR